MIVHIMKLKRLVYCIVCFLSCTSISYANSTLNNFIGQTLENNPAIQAAKSNVLAAKARGRASNNALYNPEITAEKQNGIENTTNVVLSQTFDWVNKQGARGQVGAASLRVAMAQLAALQQELAAQILGALAKYQAATRVATYANERTNLLRQFVDLTKKRYKSGDVARVDLDLAQLALSEALALEADAQVNANRALQILRAMTGLTQANWPQLPAQLPSLESRKINVESYINELPSISIFSQQYQTATARIKLAERQRYPDPTIGLQGGESSESGVHKRLIGITLNIPLFIRNPYSAEVDAASYDAMEADGNRMNGIRQAKAEIVSSAERYQTLYRATKQWQQSAGVPLSDGMILIERLWQAGEINSTDYIVQLKQRIDSQIAGAELKGRAWEAWVEWLKASGQVNRWLQLKESQIGA